MLRSRAFCIHMSYFAPSVFRERTGSFSSSGAITRSSSQIVAQRLLQQTSMLKKFKMQVGPEDVLALAGAAALLYGIHLLSRPAAFIMAGVLAIALSIMIIARGKKN